MKTTTLLKTSAFLFLSMLSMESVSAQTISINGNHLNGNQTGDAMYLEVAPLGVSGPYLELIPNSTNPTWKSSSIGYVSGYNSSSEKSISHNFYTRGSSGSWDSRFRILQNGQVQIGNQTPGGIHADYRLAIDGKLVSKSIFVTNPTTWADFVFSPTYKHMSLLELDSYLKVNKHLPAIPAASEIMANGYSVAEMDAKLLQTVEELTLHVIELSKQNKQLQDRTAELEQKLSLNSNHK